MEQDSLCLSEDGIVHRIELYGEDGAVPESLAAYFHHRWPERS